MTSVEACFKNSGHMVASVRSGHFAHLLAAGGIVALAETSWMDVFIEPRLRWIPVTFVALKQMFVPLTDCRYTRKGEVMLGEELLPVHHTATLTRTSSILAGKLEKECGAARLVCSSHTKLSSF